MQSLDDQLKVLLKDTNESFNLTNPLNSPNGRVESPTMRKQEIPQPVTHAVINQPMKVPVAL